MKTDLKISKVVLSEEEIQTRIHDLAESLNELYGDEEVIVIGVLKGCFVFMADLIRKLTCDAQVYFIEISSYGSGTKSSGNITIKKGLDVDIEGKHVLIAEDIVDSGNTLNQLTAILREKRPKSLTVCTLLNKPSRREVDFDPDYTGFVIPDKFIVGYGLDYAGRFRQLPYIAEVELENE